MSTFNDHERFSLKSHPDRLLVDHLIQVGIGCEQLLKTILVDTDSPFLFLCLGKFSENNSDPSLLKTLKEDLLTIMIIMGIAHDLGKATSFFQSYLKFKDAFYSSDLKTHSLISSLFGYIMVKRYIEIENPNRTLLITSHRDSFGFFYDILPYLVHVAIRKHHGNLENEFELLSQSINKEYLLVQFQDLISQPEFNSLMSTILDRFRLNQLLALHQTILDDVNDLLMGRTPFFSASLKIQYKKAVRKEKSLKILLFFWQKLFFSILIQADKMNTVFEQAEFERDLDFSYSKALDLYRMKKQFCISAIDRAYNEKKYLQLNNLRSAIFNSAIGAIKQEQSLNFNSDLNVHFPIFYINVPTGMGKTLAAFGSSFTIRDIYMNADKTPPRIFYCLPFLSIIDQTYAILEDILTNSGNPPLSNILLMHHHLSENVYKKHSLFETEMSNYSGNEANLLIEGWESEFIMTTFHQFLYSIFSDRNALNRRFYKYYRSIVILDEIQAIPLKYWKLIRELIEFLRIYMNITFIILTATLPKIIPDTNVTNLIKDSQLQHRLLSLNRIDLHIDLKPYFLNEFVKKVWELPVKKGKSSSDKSILIVLNTRKEARACYDLIKSMMNDDTSSTPFFLSSEIVPKQRLEIINRIKGNPKGKILISTQVVEAGVDLDFEFVFRDFAPLDSIIQVAGRCNRNYLMTQYSCEKGQVYIFTVQDEQSKLFASKIYDQDLLQITRKIFSELISNPEDLLTLTEPQFSSLIRRYYQKIDEYKTDQTLTEYLDYFENLSFEKIARDFRLIEQLTTYSFFLELDDEAKNLKEEFYNTLKMEDRFQKKVLLKGLTNKMSKFIINVLLIESEIKLIKEKLTKHSIDFIENGFTIIPKNKIADFYDVTGLIL